VCVVGLGVGLGWFVVLGGLWGVWFCCGGRCWGGGGLVWGVVLGGLVVFFGWGLFLGVGGGGGVW